MNFDIKKFDGRINFDLWKVQVKNVLIHLGVHKELIGNTSKMEANKWMRGNSGHIKRNCPGREQCIKKTLRQVLTTSLLFWKMMVILYRR
jgi:hypothetical protein